MLRMPSNQPPQEENTIVAAGRKPYRKVENQNAGLDPNAVLESYPPASGNQPSWKPNSHNAKSATQKYGTAARNVDSGLSVLSTRLPARQPQITPTPVPMQNARIVVMPTNNSVHGNACPISDFTGVG